MNDGEAEFDNILGRARFQVPYQTVHSKIPVASFRSSRRFADTMLKTLPSIILFMQQVAESRGCTFSHNPVSDLCQQLFCRLSAEVPPKFFQHSPIFSNLLSETFACPHNYLPGSENYSMWSISRSKVHLASLLPVSEWQHAVRLALFCGKLLPGSSGSINAADVSWPYEAPVSAFSPSLFFRSLAEVSVLLSPFP